MNIILPLFAELSLPFEAGTAFDVYHNFELCCKIWK
jgi:hypothetical protein